MAYVVKTAQLPIRCQNWRLQQEISCCRKYYHSVKIYIFSHFETVVHGGDDDYDGGDHDRD